MLLQSHLITPALIVTAKSVGLTRMSDKREFYNMIENGTLLRFVKYRQ